MKTYYDLTAKEKKTYVKEFKKTPVGKEMNTNRIFLVVLFVIAISIDFLFGFLFTETEYNAMENLILASQTFTFAISFIYNAYFNINFTAWLKNKYEIKRW